MSIECHVGSCHMMTQLGTDSATQPQNPNCPLAKYYCDNQKCDVRTVEVYMKLYGDDEPTMYCPACGERLRKLGYVYHHTRHLKRPWREVFEGERCRGEHCHSRLSKNMEV